MSASPPVSDALVHTFSHVPLSYGLSLLTHLCPLPFHVFKNDGHYLEKFDSNERDDWNVLKTDLALRGRLLERVRKEGLSLIQDESPVLFGGVQCHEGLTLLVGPVSMTHTDAAFLQLYASKHGAENCPLQYCEPSRLAATLLLVNTAVTGRIKSVNRLLDDSFLSRDLVEMVRKRMASVFTAHTLEGRPHNPVTLEANIRKAIREGDPDKLTEALDSPYAAMRGTLSKNELRSAQNLAIVDITIATREAIDAGLSVEELYVLSDSYILEVEECKYPADAAALARSCALQCAKLVGARRYESAHTSTTSALVRRACAYIDHHIYEKTDIKTMARRLKVSEGYLSRTFREGKGMTLLEYAHQKKIHLATTLLTGSDKSLQEIADLLGFSSQSHFGKVFTRVIGQTPGQYRSQHTL